MNIDEVVFARKIPGKRYFATNFSTWPGILLLLMVSTRQKHQYQGEKCARHGITDSISCKIISNYMKSQVNRREKVNNILANQCISVLVCE